MNEINRYEKCKWITLMAFAVMYNFVYIGRFNVTDLMPNIAKAIHMTEQQQNYIAISVFFSYALGSMINGWLSDRYGGKKIVIVGGTVSIAANVLTVAIISWQQLLLLQTINGYFQSMIWVGGISMLANWLPPGERGQGVGVANFFSGLSHVTANGIPALFILLIPALSWRGQVVLPVCMWGIFLVLFAILSKNRPEENQLPPYKLVKEDMKVEVRAKRVAKKPRGFLQFFAMNKSFFAWCTIALLSSMCRYGLLNWIPEYFHVDTGKAILSESFSNLILPIGMALGTLVITWLGGSKFNKNKGLVIVWAAALCGTLIIVFPMVDSSRVVLTGVFFSGFFLYGINGMLWLYAIDAGCRYFSGTMAGFLNGFAYLGATLEAFIFPAVIKGSGNMLSVFVVMEALCIAIIVCGIVVSKKDTIVEPEVRE